ncbi:alanine dehydrogenase [Salibacterium qingdaonense]|uniref:Alanine dehydrogenase n=1 Tax=Salibacterium qingdaonense TaxID=266892 RepID=A0A1I4MJN0_9BACI|nr:alanine dehydrogenase [Salibacterium qingdaonense]SFM03429.1 L-alanine dehydrogenase [Salibacterium qingdaonense]
MIIGIPKEIKNNENRVAMTPAGVHSFAEAGHHVLVETSAGEGSGFSDAEYEEAGAKIETEAADVWNNADLVLKVKEPLAPEFSYFREDLLLFTYLHLAAEPDLVHALVESGMTSVAYETVEVNGTLPLLTPMSEVAGRMSSQIGAQFLEKSKGGKGILLSGVPGVKRGKVTVIGGGIVGTNAAVIAQGLGADVTIVDVNPGRLREIDNLYHGAIRTMMSNPMNIAEEVKHSDLVIGAVLIPGAKAPRLVTEEMVKSMTPGSVVVDVAIDQGGIIETADTMTTHDQPTYTKHNVLHYAVANMPGAVPRTSTIALTNVTLPYALEIAGSGIHKAAADNPALEKGINTAGGAVTYKAVAQALGYPHTEVSEAMKS